METQTYNYKVVRQFAVMTVVWGIVGMLVGVIIAAQLFAPNIMNLTDIGPWFHFGRLRPLHTNAVIFAFGGCGLFATSYYVVQRTCNVRLFGGNILPAITFRKSDDENWPNPISFINDGVSQAVSKQLSAICEVPPML